MEKNKNGRQLDILLIWGALGLLFLGQFAAFVYLNSQDVDSGPIIRQIDAKGTDALKDSNKRITLIEDRLIIIEKKVFDD